MRLQDNSMSNVIHTLFSITVLLIAGCSANDSPEHGTNSESTVRGDADHRQLIRDFTRLYVESDENLPFTARFLGMQTMQNPTDMWVIQEIISDVQPDFIIETGTARGGSALFYATVLNAVNPHGRVISIDVDPRVEKGMEQIASPELRNRVARTFETSIEVIQSNSIDPNLVEQLAKRTRDKQVLVILDSCHHSRHVIQELELYSALVPTGSYIIVQDTIIDRSQKWIDLYAQCPGHESEAGPAKAVAEFLRTHHEEFEADTSRERYLLTFCPGGFLRRK
ncbi:MAG: CmcI family methyltransferase [Planctomycetota bacterium]